MVYALIAEKKTNYASVPIIRMGECITATTNGENMTEDKSNDNKYYKTCPYCGKVAVHMDRHILRNHPSVINKIESPGVSAAGDRDTTLRQPSFMVSTPTPAPLRGNINELIRDKLDTMLNIKIIEMLARSPETSLQSIAEAINPPQKRGLLEELRQVEELHKIMHPEEKEYIETGNQWVDIAQQALPIFKELTQKKAAPPQGGVNNVRARETANPRVLKPICNEIAGDTGESGSDSKESGTTSPTEQQDNNSTDTAR